MFVLRKLFKDQRNEKYIRPAFADKIIHNTGTHNYSKETYDRLGEFKRCRQEKVKIGYDLFNSRS